jgi:hypothetical protein
VRRFVLLAALVLAPLASASPPAPSIAVVESPPYVFGQQVSFAWQGPDADLIRVRCVQGGAIVLRHIYEPLTNPTAPMALGPTPSWPGGDADCSAFLQDDPSHCCIQPPGQDPFERPKHVLARVDFFVEG